jgi:hypothetical protein
MKLYIFTFDDPAWEPSFITLGVISEDGDSAYKFAKNKYPKSYPELYLILEIRDENPETREGFQTSYYD